MSKSSNTFHLGLTMAGAVSAGAYTAGFMDYILEALAAWENAKQNPSLYEKDIIPNHNVIIDAIGGASAGGMVSMITALALCEGNLKPVKDVAHTKTGNMLYDSWVFLEDDDSLYDGKGAGQNTFEKMLSTTDIKDNKGAPSLLNSQPIDRIAETVFENLSSNASKDNFPSYISEDLRILLTVTSLRPLDYKIKLSRIKSKFLDSTPGHRISNHDIVAHFKVNYDEQNDKNEFLPFRPLAPSTDTASNRDFLIKVTKATGAFPVGLAPRYFDTEFPMAYVQENLKKRKAFNADMAIEFDKQTDDTFKFTAVDGGTINNEPFDEVLRCLEDRHGPEDANNPKYGTILIDPFPNFENEMVNPEHDYEKTSIMDIVGNLVPTILNQARNKQSDTFGSGIFKLMAFPRKLKLGNIEEEVDHPPLATGGIGGFGGFLDIEFRKHDFFLGRKNAKNFLRGFFFTECHPEDKDNLFYGVSDKAIAEFSREVDGKLYMPIIPDVSKLDPNDEDNPTRYKMDFPKFDVKAFRTLEKPIKNRVKAILKAELSAKIDSWFLRQVVWLFRGKIAKRITSWVMKTIENDFKKRMM